MLPCPDGAAVRLTLLARTDMRQPTPARRTAIALALGNEQRILRGHFEARLHTDCPVTKQADSFRLAQDLW